MTQHKVETQIQNNKVIYKRYFDAPIDLVFEAWTSHEHLSQWWGPDGFTISTQKLEFTNGGTWSFVMHGPDGKDYKNKIQFIEIQKPRLIFLRHIGDGETNNTEDVHMQARVSFETLGSGTQLTMEQIFPTREELERVEKEYGAIEGGKQHIGNLAKYIDKIKE